MHLKLAAGVLQFTWLNDRDAVALQDVWCKPLLSGDKVEETRRYTLPEEFIGALRARVRFSL